MLKDLEYFVKTVDFKSMSAAAIAFNVLPATISAAIKRLEKEYGQNLLVRSTRSLRPTPQGEVFYQACLAALNILDKAQENIGAEKEQIRGSLYISAPSDFGRHWLRKWLDQMLAHNPKLQIFLNPNDQHVDFFQERVDFAIRYGAIKDSALVSRELIRVSRVLCASPSYLTKAPKLTHPQDITHHWALCFCIHNKPYKKWRFNKADEEVVIEANSRRHSSDSELTKLWAKEGFGLVYKSELDVYEDIKQNLLVRCLPNWDGDQVPIHLIYPKEKENTYLTRYVVRFLQKKTQALQSILVQRLG
jgi:DNA-binding transcriptional LysR family regulator